MKVKARKLLSLLLTLAMVVGMFVLPASAALSNNDASNGIHVIDPAKDTVSSGATINEYFTCGAEDSVKVGTAVAASGLSYDSAIAADDKLTATDGNLPHFETGECKPGNNRYIEFTTAANKDVKIRVWWSNTGNFPASGDNSGKIARLVKKADWSKIPSAGKTAPASVELFPAMAGTKNTIYLTEKNLLPNTAYRLMAGNSSVHFYRVEVIETEKSVSTNPLEDVALTVVAGTYTATAAEAADANAAKTKAEALVAAVVNNNTITATVSDGATYTAPVAGTASAPQGKAGSYSFTITLSNGTNDNVTTDTITMDISATPYEPAANSVPGNGYGAAKTFLAKNATLPSGSTTAETEVLTAETDDIHFYLGKSDEFTLTGDVSDYISSASGITYSTNYVAGKNNPKTDGSNTAIGKVPETGTYYKFVADKAGKLEIVSKINAGKTFVIVKGGETPSTVAQVAAVGEALDGWAVAIDVEASASYYVYAASATKLPLYGFTFWAKGSTEQPGDDALTGITVSDPTVNLKVGETKDVTVTVSPEGCTEELDVANTAPAIATATLTGNKLTIKANGTTAGTAKITVSGTTATTVKAEITVKVSLKQMTCALHESGQGMTYLPSKVYDGKPYTVKAKVKDVETKKVIENATIKYATTENGPFTDANDPTRTDAGTTVFYFQATAEGYETYTSTEGHRININKANPKLNIEADPARVKQANDADRFTTLTVTCDLPYADVDKVTVTGKDKNGNALDASKIVKVEGKKGVYTVHFNEPDTEAVYTFTASYDGKNADGSLNPNFNAATDTTTNVTVINHTVVDRTYKLTYDSTKIKITYPDDQGSTDDKVLYAATVKAEAINIPEGQEFDCWVSTDVTDPADKDWASKNPTEFAMPGRDVKLEVKFKDKTEEPENVTKAALYDLLRNAEAYAESPVVATNADDVDKGEKWVTAADKKLFTDAIKAAQDVSSNPKATQAQVDEAVADLAEAWDAFTAAFKDGTKSSGSSEPVKVTHTFESKTLPATAAADVANSDYAEDNYFKLVVKNGKTKYDKSNKEWTAEAFGDNAYNPGVDAIRFNSGDAAANAGIKFTTTSENAKVQIWWVQTGGDYWKDGAYDSTKYKDLRQVVVLKDGTQVHTSDDKHPDPNAAAGAATGRVKQNDPKYNEFTLADAATYTVGANTSGIYIFKIVVTETTTTGGGDTPVVPDTAARTALKEAIKAAKENMDSVKTSTDGSEYSKDELWVTERAKTTYKRAIELAEFKANSARFDDEALVEAKAALDAVTADFNAAKREGTKSSGSSSGGSSSSNVPSTGGGTTVKNEDGSKTTTKTDKTTGTVTETTTWPNGDKQVVVTEKDGTKTETVTKKDGSKTETVTKPDGSTTTAVTDTKGIKTETAVTASGEVSAKVSLPKNVDKTVVTIPVKDATEGTVAVIVDSKGNETVIKTAVATENGLELLVTGNVSVQIKDNAKKFVDIADDYWAKGAVDFVSSREIFKGVYETVFAPADLVNRGMMATVLYRLADAKAEGSNNFFDVPDGTWYTDAVTWANRSGVVTGYADGTFGPADAVTREQMATMLFRYAKAMGMDISAKGDVSKFSDANDVSSWASEAMTWAVGVGLINGVADPATGTTLSPTKTATRAEVATIMQRMVKLMMK